jgi:hypothetical protein
MQGFERRRFFRIDDRLRLSVRRLPDDQGKAQSAGDLRSSDIMLEMDRRIAAIINAARVQAPAVAELAEMLNRKVNHVIDTLELRDELARRAAFREHEVVISACGLGLETRERFEPDERVVIELLFSPDDTELRILARVVRCTTQAEDRHLLFVDFVGINPGDQEFLIQYIVRRQSALLQRLREERESAARAEGGGEPE